MPFAVLVFDSDIDSFHATVNMELVVFDNCLKHYRLSLDVSKTSYMIISIQKIVFHDIAIRGYESFNSQIPWRYTLDENLTFNDHVNLSQKFFLRLKLKYLSLLVL